LYHLRTVDFTFKGYAKHKNYIRIDCPIKLQFIKKEI
jgi:hypothetical protein